MDTASAVRCLTRLRVLDGAGAGVIAERAGGRNDNTIVRCNGRASYLIKRPHLADPLAARFLRDEAQFCIVCAQRDSVFHLRGLIPHVVAWDPDDGTCVYELIEGAVPLWTVFERLRESTSFSWIGLQLGTKLAILQRRCTELLNDSPTLLSTSVPTALDIHRPVPADLRFMSTGACEFISVLQRRSMICERLDEMREQWRPSAVVHGDIRSQNVLISFESSSGERARLHFVDFETVRWGDPAWDIAGALQDIALFWIASMTPNSDVAQMTRSASHPLTDIQLATRALLQGYLRAGDWRGEGTERFIARAVTFSAARLVQSAYEFAAQENEVPASAVLSLQLAENILVDPWRAAKGFYAIA